MFEPGIEIRTRGHNIKKFAQIALYEPFAFGGNSSTNPKIADA